MTATITCPECARTSHHPEDIANGWCGACCDVTAIDKRAWNDDARGGTLMRAHVHQRRVADLLASFAVRDLRLHARNRDIPSGGTKAALAARIVEAGFTAGDIRRHVYIPRWGDLRVGTNFYTDADPTCDNPEHTERLHVGLSSFGWKFLFQGYPDRGLTSWTAWRVFLAGREIRDENGRTLTLDEFTERVENRAVPQGELPFCRITPSARCRAVGFGGRWEPRNDEYHDPQGYDFCDSEFS